MTAADTLQALTRDTFVRLAEALEGQPDGAWDSPSLCERWRVREVVAHMSTAARRSAEEFMAEVRADGGAIDATLDRLAALDGQLPPETLLANLRDDRLHQWTPPGSDERGALIHVVVHGLDVTTPLALDSPADEAAVRIVLDALAEGLHTAFGVATDGVQLQAVDLDWVRGEGRPVRAAAVDLVAVLAGRSLDPTRVSGELAPVDDDAEG